MGAGGEGGAREGGDMYSAAADLHCRTAKAKAPLQSGCPPVTKMPSPFWYKEGTFHMGDLFPAFRGTKDGQNVLVLAAS